MYAAHYRRDTSTVLSYWRCLAHRYRLFTGLILGPGVWQGQGSPKCRALVQPQATDCALCLPAIPECFALMTWVA